MAGANGDKKGASNAGAQAKGRGPRRRTLLNLGVPFVPVDDFINQAEEAVAASFEVLEQVVNEIRSGYKQAEDYNKTKLDNIQSGDPPPPIPWQDMVERAQRLNNIAIGAMASSSRIFIDSVAAGLNATNKLAGTLATARTDADKDKPRLAGPVFAETLTWKFRQGQAEPRAEWPIDHPALTRLRILVQPSPLQQGLTAADKDKGVPQTLRVKDVTFEPDPKNREKACILTMELADIPPGQATGRYVGRVVATNFDLLIAQLEIMILEPAKASAKGAAKAR